MQTIVQFASAKMGDELRAWPTLRLPITNAHMTAMEIKEIIRPGKVVVG